MGDHFSDWRKWITWGDQGRGQRWEPCGNAAAADRDVRVAEPSGPTPVAPHSGDPDTTLTSSTADGSALVTLMREGQVCVDLVSSGTSERCSGVAQRPGSGPLAIADSVQVVDITTGISKVTYRGASGPIADVVWSSDGSRIWALSGNEVVGWLRRTGSVLLDQPDSWFVAVFRSTSRGASSGSLISMVN